MDNLRPPIDLESLSKLLKVTNAKTRVWAIQELPSIGGSQVIELLTVALKDEDFRVRAAAFAALGSMDDALAIAAMLCVFGSEEAMLMDSDAVVRAAAVKTLAKLGDKSVTELLVRTLADHDANVQCSAIVALGNIGDPRAVEALGEIYIGTILERQVNDEATDGHFALMQSRRTIRREAATAIGKIGGQRAEELLVEMLLDVHSYSRSVAIDPLVQAAGERAIEPLSCLLDDEDYYLRFAVTEALVKIGTTAAVEPLAYVLSNPDILLRKTALGGLGKIASPEVIKPLVQALSDSIIDIRIAAADALVQTGRREALPHLKASLKTFLIASNGAARSRIQVGITAIERSTASSSCLPRSIQLGGVTLASRPRSADQTPQPGQRPRDDDRGTA